MKKFFLAMAVALVSATSFAQDTETKKVNASVGVELAAPIGDFADSHKFGIGGSAQVEYMAAEKVGITLNAGYITYTGKTVAVIGKYPSYSQIPILAGARYYFIKDIYVSGQLGLTIGKLKGFDSETGFTYAPGIGIKVSVIDLTLKYTGVSAEDGTVSNVGLRAAFTF